jgi:sensor domain CHASE-containing protein/signal transduction histidine kinase
MTLRTRTLISIGLTIAVLIVVLYTISRVIVLGSFAALEEQYAHQSLERILSLVQDDIEALDLIVFDWAAWDDTYAFIEDANEEYIESNLVDETFTSPRLNFMLYVDADGELVYGKGYDPYEEEEIAVPQSLLQHATGDTVLARHSDTEGVTKGILLLPEGPLFVASRPILTSEEEGPIRGALIMARYFDDSEVELLSETALLPFTAQQFAEAPADLRTPLSAGEPMLLRRQKDAITGYALLNDVYGDPALVLHADMPRQIYQYGQRSVSYFMVSLLVTGLVFGTMTLLLLERSVLARLAHLSADVHSIGTSGDLSRRVAVSGKDELSTLADTLNRMLTRLEQAQAERQRAEEALRQYSYTLAQLNQLGQQLTATLERQQLAEQLSRIATEMIDTEGMSIWLLDTGQKEELVCWFAYNRLKPEEERSLVDLRLRVDQGVVGWVMQHKENVIVSDTAADSRFFPDVDEKIEFQTRSLLAVPLRVRGSVIGVLEMVNKLTGEFSEDDLNLAETLAASTAIAVDNARLIEELRQYTAELEAQNAELDAFAHTVAHDLRNPLSVLVGVSSYLEEMHARIESNEVVSNLHTITQTGEKLTNIINELLLLASVRKMEDIDTGPLDMATIVGEAQERLADMIEETRAEVTVPDAWPLAVGHSPWIEEVWVNYISNALKYGGTMPRVELGATEQGEGFARFWIRDNGRGIAKEEQERLFTQFARLHQVHVEGYGLGLSIVQRIIEKLGGKVGVESEPGQGSTFYFTLPMAGS